MSFNHQQKVYLPTDARTNQYITAEIKLTDALLSQYPDYLSCYQALAKQFFELADKHDLRNVHVIANDKLPVVRFHTEAYCLETDQQVIFFYNPRYHEAQNLFARADYRTRKIRFLFLAVGDELRANSATFHTQVQGLLAEFAPTLALEQPIKVRDHQHLTYDLFARAKGNKKTYGFKLRGIAQRYKARKCELPEDVSSLSYVTVTLPLGRRLKQRLGGDNNANYGAMYQKLQDSFHKAVNEHGFKRSAMVANGLLPLVRNSKFDRLSTDKGVQMLGFDPNAAEPQFLAHWQADNLVETAFFVVAAGKEDHEDAGFGRFMNEVEDALRQFARDIEIDGERQDLVVRFHQHISYKR
ncbi:MULTISPECIES: DUF3083 family protein [Shewanella]|jgi:hypothetical protein|uniref:DUF3083 family protein n=2 Tax=Shewanella TaxID=22 RepID=A0AAJ1F265_9GAMM|nr:MULTISPECIES: DUF3083 family protein [Shewanella]AZQ10260.1 hypothetical protein STH12_01124 [Shewanella khirikhana]MCH4296238.1 DUF3083 family protein [Shewanella zhuhaiensis]